MKRASSGLLVYKIDPELKVFLVHPGGPFWRNKDIGAWSIPKGENDENEDPLVCARREFKEETGKDIEGNFIPLNPIKQKGGKTVIAWAVKNDIDPDTITSNHILIEWPPKSQKQISIPEIDRGQWFNIAEARIRLNPKQVAFIDELLKILDSLE